MGVDTVYKRSMEGIEQMTRGISEERLIEISVDPEYEYVGIFKAIKECEELNQWKPIDENTPKDRALLLFYPENVNNYEMITNGNYNPHSFRQPTHWAELPINPPNAPD